MLASVYYKPPENFVKKIRDRINERLDLENEFIDEYKGKGEEDYVDSTKRSEYLKDSTQVESYHNYIQGDEDLLGVADDDTNIRGNLGIDDLLGGGSSKAEERKKAGQSNLLDIMDSPV